MHQLLAVVSVVHAWPREISRSSNHGVPVPQRTHLELHHVGATSLEAAVSGGHVTTGAAKGTLAAGHFRDGGRMPDVEVLRLEWKTRELCDVLL